MKTYKIPAIRLTQKASQGHEIFFGKIKILDLIDPIDEDKDARFKIHQWENLKSDTPGYQRAPDLARVEKIKNYIQIETSQPIFPTTLLVNARKSLNFNEKFEDFGELVIDQQLFVIDGQHRIAAFKDMASNDELRGKYGYVELPIVVLSNFKYEEEVEQFFVINSRQRKIKTDLAQRIYLELSKKDINTRLIPEKDKWQGLAAKIVDSLNENPSSIWYQLIELPNDPKDIRKERLISQNYFIKSLKPFFSGATKKWDYSSGSYNNGKDIVKECTSLLEDYWKMIKGVYEESFLEKKKSILFKTVGVVSLHMVLAEFLSKYPSLTQKEAISKLQELLVYARDYKKFTPEFWQVGNTEARNKGLNAGAYSSSAGHNRIAMAILNRKGINEF
jgi:DGQHR domain-containing protein